MKPAVIYTRFSPRPDAEEALSIETQLERCKAYCESHSLMLLESYQDAGMSGARADNRPGLQAALEHVCSEGAVLVVYSLSRMARSTMDAIKITQELEKYDANLASITESIDTTNAMGRFFFKIVASLAELERELIVERTRDAMLRHQANGRRMSDRTPFGWVRDTDPAFMVEDETEQKVIRIVCQMHKITVPWRQICRSLDQMGYRCRGGKFHHQTIRRILVRAGVIS